MRSSPLTVASRLLLNSLVITLFFPHLFAQVSGQSVIRTLNVLGTKDVVEVEVEATNQIVPQTQVLTGPDRLVIDFPNAVPSPQLRSQSINRGEVKDVRVGRFQATPPVTRVVIDLKSASSYQVFPYGRTVMIKMAGTAMAGTPSQVASGITEVPAVTQAHASLVSAKYTASREDSQPDPVKPLEVNFRDGMLTIHATKATLSQVLSAVQQRTGAQISSPAGAEQEQVVADLGPGPVQEVLAHLLNGSRFNFLILNAANDPRRLDRVILTPRVEGVSVSQPVPVQASNASDDDDQPIPQPPPRVEPPPGVPVPAGYTRPPLEGNQPRDENAAPEQQQ